MFGNGNLRFSKVTRKDNGVYDCEVSGNGQFGETRVKLTVLGKDHKINNILTQTSLSYIFVLCGPDEN